MSDFLVPLVAILAALLVGLNFVVLAYLHTAARELETIRRLIAAYMENQVSETVAQNKLVAAVEAANKPFGG